MCCLGGSPTPAARHGRPVRKSRRGRARGCTAAPTGPSVAAEVDEAPAAESEQPEGEFDVEAWVAAVYDYQHNGGPKPVRTYRVAPAEALHVDAAGHVTAVERGAEQAAEQAAEGAELEAAGDESVEG